MVVVLLALLAQGAFIMWCAKGAYFWNDDWDFLLRRGTVPGESFGWFAPHNGHWSTGPVLVMRALFSVFGMKTYMPYALVVVLIHLAIAGVSYVLFRRAGTSDWVAAASAVLMTFVAVGLENVIWDAAMNNTGALLLGIVSCYVLLSGGGSRRALITAWVLLVFALSCSGTGISAVVFASVFAASQYRPIDGLRVASVPAGVFVLWYAAIGASGESFWVGSGRDYFKVPLFIWTGLTKALGNSVGITELGPVLFLAIVVILLTDHRSSPAMRHLAWGGIAAATAQLALEGFGRIALGVEQAGAGRYAYFTVVLLLPAVTVTLTRISRMTVEPRWVAGTAAAVLMLSYIAHGVGELLNYRDFYHAVSAPWKGRLLGMVASADAGQEPLTDEYDDAYNKFITQDLVASPQIRAALPEGEPTVEERLAAETMFNIGVGTKTYDLFRPAFVDLTFGWNRDIKNGPGCALYRATVPSPMLQIATQDGIEVGITSEATEVVTRLMRDDKLSEGRIWEVEPGSIHIASTAKNAVLQVSFNAGGEYTICKQ